MDLKFKLDFFDDKVNAWHHKTEFAEFKTESGGSVDIKGKLVMRFLPTDKIEKGGITFAFISAWHECFTGIEVDDIGDSVFECKLTLTPKIGDSFERSLSKVHICVSKSSEKAIVWSTFRDSFAAAADAEPSVEGELVVTCALAPSGLEAAEMGLRWVCGSKSESLSLKFGESKSFPQSGGSYQIQAASELKAKNGDLRSTVVLSAKEITVKKGQSTEPDIEFGSIEHSSTIDTLPGIGEYPELHGEEIKMYTKEGEGGSNCFLLHSSDVQHDYHKVVFDKNIMHVKDGSKDDVSLNITGLASRAVKKIFTLNLIISGFAFNIG